MVNGDPGSLEPVPQHVEVELRPGRVTVTIQLRITMGMIVLEMQVKLSAVLDFPLAQLMVIGDPGSLVPVPQHVAVELLLELGNATILYR